MRDAPSKGDQARADILEAAKHLFVSQGYHGTSMRTIARDAGNRAVAGLYNHFPTKEAIFVALIEEHNPYHTLIGILEPLVEQCETAPEFVRSALRTVLEAMPRHYDFIQLAQIDLREFEGKNLGHVLETQTLPRIFGIIQHVLNLPGLKPIDAIVWIRLMASLVIGFMVTSKLMIPNLFSQYFSLDWAEIFADALLYGVAEPNFQDDEKGNAIDDIRSRSQ